MQELSRYGRVTKITLHLAGWILLAGNAFAQTTSAGALPDAQIEANVLKALAAAPQLANESISTTTVYGVVTLTGTVKDESSRRMAEDLASRASGVKKVVDELGVGAADSSNAANNSNASNPTLQSDGTMAPAAGQPQHAPDPDVYAAQRGVDTAPTQASAPNDNNGSYGQTQPPLAQQNGQGGYRQPYNGPYGGQQPMPQGGQERPEDVQRPYQPGSVQRGGPQRGQAPPPPYGAQLGGKPVTIQQGALLRVRINEGLDSKHTQPGTAFDAVVLNDVVADGAVAIPRGASVEGKVTEARSGGVIKGHGELALQLTQVTLGGQVYPITSDVWQRDSSDKGSQTVNSALGLGAAGAIIGAIAGGGAGAAIGAGAGAATGIGASAASGSRQVLIPSEAILTFHLAQPAPMMTISQAEMDRLSYGVPVGAQQQQMGRRYPPPPPAYYGPVYYPRPYAYPYE